MKINIITGKDKWVLYRLSKEILNRLQNSYITIFEPDGKADINIYMNYALFKNKTNAIDIGYFTHYEPKNNFDNIAKNVDYCISMCDKTATFLPKDKTTVIKFWPDKQFIKEKIVIGICAKNQPGGRKRFYLIEELKKIKGIEILITNQKYKWEDMPLFYKSIDYLVVLSDNEGGPMPVIEAIASGKTVIAPNVGWCWDYPVIKYNNINDLIDILSKLSSFTNDDGWSNICNQIKDVCNKLVCNKQLKGLSL